MEMDSEIVNFDSDSDNEYLDLPDTPTSRMKTFRPRINMGLTDFEFRFRLTSSQFEEVLSVIKPIVEYDSGRSAAMSAHEQLLITLRFLATGAFYRLIGDSHGISKSSVCRCVQRCVTAINDSLFHSQVQFPEDPQIPTKFYEMANMPSVVGCLDGTHVYIDAPCLDEPQYINRHGTHSINAMCVCGPDRRFYYVSARWPGSVNDARILRKSTLSDKFETGWRPFPNAVILGDSAYPLKEWLIPPIRHPMTEAEERFNVAHKRTRRVIENAFGVLKQRFACLKHLRVQPEFACNIFKACCVLHNMCAGELSDWNASVSEDENHQGEVQGEIQTTGGVTRRERLVNSFV